MFIAGITTGHQLENDDAGGLRDCGGLTSFEAAVSETDVQRLCGKGGATERG